MFFTDNLKPPGPEVTRIKLFSCSTQLSLKFILLINVKMPTIVGILTFMSRIHYQILRYELMRGSRKFPGGGGGGRGGEPNSQKASDGKFQHGKN